MAKILLVEDDLELAKSVSDWLRHKHHIVEHVANWQGGQERAEFYDYDVLILDWNLPDGTGVDILKKFRDRGGMTPALILTANATIADKEVGYSVGTDDYVTKPVDLRELGLRIEALLRRPRERVEKVLALGGLTLDPNSFGAERDGRKIKLMPKEFALLEFFMRNPNKVFNAEALLQRVWMSESESSTETVVTTVKRLRKKIDNEGQPSLIQTVFSVGYKFVCPDMTST